MSSKFNFTTRKSLDRLAIILNRLALGDASPGELEKVLGCERCITAGYLRKLMADGEVICSRPLKRGYGVSTPALYALAPSTKVPKLPEKARVEKVEFASGDVRKVTIRRIWAPMAIPKQSIFAALGL